MSTGYAKLATGCIATAGSLKLSTGCVVACVWLSSWAKRCRINLCKRHRFAIAISKYHLLVNSSLRLDFLLYDVTSLLRLDVQATCWYLATAGLKPSADYDDVTDDVINAKPSADSLA
ncbi:pentatricopeptide repeat-containing protein mitochondrial [Dorcoceras hygrometricum]|uniref:Pentatricopeptide repeat-containing protein mitochondrial n=1 Tax=Dorcoceras hygrometricum TaxID=472368 RepID=A0A2Z7AKG2_9LAMI|nr:pentatricopeptide repeat-containing protein mitochondrial [Dorcoceras hygrometricum]